MNVDDKNIKVSDLFLFLRKNLLVIFIGGILGFLISFVIATFFLVPKYSSSVELLVNRKDTDQATQLTTQQADLQAINTYKDLLKKPVILSPVLKQVKKSNNYDGNIGDLQDSIKINNQEESQIISVSVSDKNAYTAADIANTIGEVFTDKIKKMMKVNNVNVVSKGVVSYHPVFPNKKLISIIGLIVGILISLAIVMIKSIFDTTVKDEKFLTNEVGLNNLGIIYHIDKSKSKLKVVQTKSNKPEKGIDKSRKRI